MSLDIAQAVRDGKLHRATRRQRNITKLDLIEPHEEGDPWKINCDVISFCELGPGVPLYFTFVQHAILVLCICFCLYCFVALHYFFSSEVFFLDENKQRPRGDQGTNMQEWTDGLYVGCSMYGMRRLWNKSINSQYLPPSKLQKFIMWFSAASRGPWRGHNETCIYDVAERLSVTITSSVAALGSAVSGRYAMCGWSNDLPWFGKIGGHHVLHLQQDASGNGAWQLAELNGPGVDLKALERLDTSLLKPHLAEAMNHSCDFPNFIDFEEDVVVRLDGNSVVQENECRPPPGVPQLHCYDVAERCPTCQKALLVPSLFGQEMSKDSDVLVVSCACAVIFALSIPCLREFDRLKIDDSKGRSVSDDDFAVYVTNLPSKRLQDDLDEDELATFLRDSLDSRHSSEGILGWQRSFHHIVRVTFTFRLGRIFNMLNRDKAAEQQLERLRVVIKNLESSIEKIEDCILQARSFRQRQLLRLQKHGKRLSLWRAVRVQARARDEKEKRLEAISRVYDSLYVAGAIVTFERAAAARNALKAFGGGGWNFRSLWEHKDVDTFRGHVLRMERPPEPSDVMWENLGEPIGVLILYRLAGLSIELTCMVILAIITFQLRMVGAGIRKQSHDGVSIIEFLFVIFTSGAVVAADVVMREILCKLVVLQKYQSWTRTASSSMLRLTLAAILNGALVVLIVHVLLDDQSIACEKNWYLRGNLAEDVLSISMVSMATTPVIQLLPHWNVPQLIKQFILLQCPAWISQKLFDPETSRMTQDDLVDLFSGAEYRIAYRYATILRTIFLTLCFAPIVPLVVPVGVMGLFLQYWADKLCLIKMARRPPYQGLEMHRHARMLLPLTMMPIPLLTVFLLRGTSFQRLWQWLRPCIHPDILFRSYSTAEDIRWAQVFVLYIAVVIPMAVAFLVAFGRGGAVCLRRSIRFLCLCGLVGKVAGYLWQRLSSILPRRQESKRWDESSDDEEEPMNYYTAQHFIPSLYHKSNPVYRMLPSTVNPDTLVQPEPKKLKKSEIAAPWSAQQARREEQRRQVDEIFTKRTNGGKAAALFVGTCGETALPVQFAFEKLLGFSASFESAVEEEKRSSVRPVRRVHGLNMFCAALREHQDEEKFRIGGELTRRTSTNVAMHHWQICMSNVPTEKAKARWALVRRVFLKDHLSGVANRAMRRHSSIPFRQSQRSLEADETEIEMEDRSLTMSALTLARRTAMHTVYDAESQTPMFKW